MYSRYVCAYIGGTIERIEGITKTNTMLFVKLEGI